MKAELKQIMNHAADLEKWHDDLHIALIDKFAARRAPAAERTRHHTTYELALARFNVADAAHNFLQELAARG